ncbi:MAG: hypothetical protein ABI364_03810 [Caldimonas sp.]
MVDSFEVTSAPLSVTLIRASATPAGGAISIKALPPLTNCGFEDSTLTVKEASAGGGVAPVSPSLEPPQLAINMATSSAAARPAELRTERVAWAFTAKLRIVCIL